MATKKKTDEEKAAKKAAKLAKTAELADKAAGEMGPAPEVQVGAIAIPYDLRRELEEIGKYHGFTADQKIAEFGGDIQALEAICNKANNPKDSWRGRWKK